MARLSDGNTKLAREIIARYPKPRSAMIPLLHLAQEQDGWVTEEAMVDGSPMLALERGDAVARPDMLYVQADTDTLHAGHNMERFCAAYRKAGGRVEEEMLEGEPYDLIRSAPESAEARRAVKRMVGFIEAHARLREAQH